MRRFRFVGDPSNYSNDFVHGNEYNSDFIGAIGSNTGANVGCLASDFSEDWEEVIPKQLHKDTDLGHFAGLAMQGILANTSALISNLTDSQKAQYSIMMARELIKQLNEQGHA